eukprot:1953797-Pleurochrysis_carterae.AAC.1
MAIWDALAVAPRHELEPKPRLQQHVEVDQVVRVVNREADTNTFTFRNPRVEVAGQDLWQGIEVVGVH